MSARISLCCCLAAAWLMAAAGSAAADPNQASVGAAPPSNDNSMSESATATPSGPDAYNRAATTDPYNQPDFSAQQTFGLTASQMLGAAAACEQLHSDRISMSNQQIARATKDSSDEERSSLDAAQEHMLDPAATSTYDLKAGEGDCDRVSGSFSQLQQIQLHDQYLPKELDQPDAVPPSAAGNNGTNNVGSTMFNISNQGQQPH